MYGIAFEWDRRKESANERKHGVEVAEATTVFDGPLSITIADTGHAIDEERCVVVGMSSERSLISARPATKHERRSYEETSL
jgi:uncharacterized DUF497 family protein